MPAIRRGAIEDLSAVARIQDASPEASHWRVEDYLTYDLWIAESQQEVIGFLVSRQLGAGEGEILNLAVAPEWRRQGIGRSLIQAFLGDCRGSVFLELRESNRAALDLYKSMGFQVVSNRPKYYESPPEAAIVMKFHSC
jgi:ribosomal-protein-alanine N-acetyltransferase